MKLFRVSKLRVATLLQIVRQKNPFLSNGMYCVEKLRWLEITVHPVKDSNSSQSYGENCSHRWWIFTKFLFLYWEPSGAISMELDCVSSKVLLLRPVVALRFRSGFRLTWTWNEKSKKIKRWTVIVPLLPVPLRLRKSIAIWSFSFLPFPGLLSFCVEKNS